jgi:manganese efflux pump family protein
VENLLTQILLSVGLALDCFAVAVAIGASRENRDLLKKALLTALSFGFFQFLMPLLGWLGGRQIREVVSSVDHWIAFSLLAFVGGGAIFESVKKRKEKEKAPEIFGLKAIFILSIATSIDAFAVGISFAFLSIPLWSTFILIGAVTVLLTFLGVFFGKSVGARYKQDAEIAGGLVLVLLGVKILIQHLFFGA